MWATAAMGDASESIVGGVSDKGARYGDLNQDSFFATEYTFGETRGVIAGVFDGHAPSGEICSRSCSDTLSQWKVNQEKLDALKADDPATFGSVLHRLFGWLHFEACDAVTEFQAECGTTAVVAIVDASTSKLGVGWAGDSVAIMSSFSAAPSSSSSTSQLSHLVVSPAHSTTNPSEIARVEKEKVLEINEDGYLAHPSSHFLRGYQVKMTRALGHRSFPIACEPDTALLNITAEDHCLVICSDGVTDLLTTAEIGDFVCQEKAQGKTPEAAARSLIDYAFTKAKDDNEKDNATAVVIFFDRLFPNQNRTPLLLHCQAAAEAEAEPTVQAMSVAPVLSENTAAAQLAVTAARLPTYPSHILYYTTLRQQRT